MSNPLTPPKSSVINRNKSTSDYVEKVLRFTYCIMDTGHLPYAHGLPWRASSWTFMPCWCGLCCMWSTCWRVVACPFMCACKGRGCGYACSNNGCTDCTDSMIGSYVHTVNQREDGLHMLCPQDYSQRLLDAITVIESHYTGVVNFNDNHRTLTATVVVPMCCSNTSNINPGSANALTLLANLRVVCGAYMAENN